jgi:hypothetical protein
MDEKLLLMISYLVGLNCLFLSDPPAVYASDSAFIYSCSFIKKKEVIKPSGICLVHISMSQGVYSGSILWEDNTMTTYEGDFNITDRLFAQIILKEKDIVLLFSIMKVSYACMKQSKNLISLFWQAAVFTNKEN